MQDKFPGHYKKTEAELNNLWKEALFSFDTNFLLNFYRYSRNSRNDIFYLLKKLNDRIWLPYHVVYEYNKNRFDVIYDQEKEYKNFNNNIKDFKDKLSRETGHPFLSESLQERFDSVIQEIEEEIKVGEDEFNKRFSYDEIYVEFEDIFRDKIAEDISPNKYTELKKTAEERFKSKTPPGYEDEVRKTGNNYGDYVIWVELLEKAKEINRPIIFITDETKEDWWWKANKDKTIGPRPELIEEMHENAGVDFHIYSPSQFYKHAKDFIENTQGYTFNETGKPEEEMEKAYHEKDDKTEIQNHIGSLELIREDYLRKLNENKQRIEELQSRLSDIENSQLDNSNKYNEVYDLSNINELKNYIYDIIHDNKILKSKLQEINNQINYYNIKDKLR